MSRVRYFLYCVVLLIWSCEEVDVILDNPLDPENSDYIAPEVTITFGPTEDEVVDTPAVTFVWEGNELVSEYRSKFDTLSWSNWSEETSDTIIYLDEGDYSFSVQSRYESSDTSVVTSVTFTVDAVQGPALMFYPRKRIVAQGSTTTFQILAEEVNNLTAAEFSIEFDPDFIEIISINQGSIFQGEGESIFFSEYDNESGDISISTALLGGETSSINGTGDLVLLEVQISREGITTLSFDGGEVFKGPDNNNIIILKSVGGVIEIQ